MGKIFLLLLFLLFCTASINTEVVHTAEIIYTSGLNIELADASVALIFVIIALLERITK